MGWYHASHLPRGFMLRDAFSQFFSLRALFLVMTATSDGMGVTPDGVLTILYVITFREVLHWWTETPYTVQIHSNSF